MSMGHTHREKKKKNEKKKSVHFTTWLIEDFLSFANPKDEYNPSRHPRNRIACSSADR